MNKVQSGQERRRHICGLALVVMVLMGAVALGTTAFPSQATSPGPNGKIAFAGGPGSGLGEIFTMNPDGTGLVNLTRTGGANDLAPDWSPDGSKIAFVSDRDENFEIYVMNADGTGLQRLTSDPAWDNHPSWSPDATEIAFVSERTGNREVFVMDADGSDLRQLTSSPGRDIWPEYSPDGQQIAFTRVMDDVSGIYTIPVQGGSSEKATPDALNAGQADWSPDGQRFVLVNNHCAACGSSDVFTIRTDGTNLTQLTSGFGNNLNPSWSPDGTKIVFWNSAVLPSGGLSHPADIWVMNVDGTQLTNVTKTRGHREVLPDWGPHPG